MGKTKPEGQSEKIKTDFHITLPRYGARVVEQVTKRREMRHAEFFRTLLDQGIAAKLPLFDLSNN